MRLKLAQISIAVNRTSEGIGSILSACHHIVKCSGRVRLYGDALLMSHYTPSLALDDRCHVEYGIQDAKLSGNKVQNDRELMDKLQPSNEQLSSECDQFLAQAIATHMDDDDR